MKNLLLLTLFITFILQSCGGGSEGELVVNKDPFNLRPTVEGKLTYKGEFYSGKIIKYYDDGTLSKVEFKGSYLNGEKDGVWEEYYDNGQTKSKYSYINGKPVDGIYSDYHKNGQLKSKGSYLNGEKNGVWEEYYKDGNLEYTYTFKDGKIENWEIHGGVTEEAIR